MILHEVITTEKVPFTYRVAGLGSRFLAYLIDASLLLLMFLAGAMLLSPLDVLQLGLGQAATFIWLFVLTFSYFPAFEWLWLGQTPGKRALGIRVIQERGTGINFFQAVVRNLVRWVDSLPWIFVAGCYTLGFGVAAAHPKNRRLGDWAAGTLVVFVEYKAPPIQALLQHDAAGDFIADQARQRLVQLDKEQKQTILDLCLRREQLRIGERARLFQAVADYLQQRCGLQPTEHQSAEKFVLQAAVVLGAEA